MSSLASIPISTADVTQDKREDDVGGGASSRRTVEQAPAPPFPRMIRNILQFNGEPLEGICATCERDLELVFLKRVLAKRLDSAALLLDVVRAEVLDDYVAGGQLVQDKRLDPE